MRDASAFLQRSGLAGVQIIPLPADASARRYARLIGGPRPALLMDTPSPEDLRRFVAIARYLAAIGLSAPEIFAIEEREGFLVVEDFGDCSHAVLLARGEEPLPLYLEAAETLAALHAAPPPCGLREWEGERMAEAAAATFLDWWWPAVFGAPPGAEIRAHFLAAIKAMLAPFAGEGVFLHRDYFPANLMRLPERSGARRTGLIDFQDAARGHPAYDLISLIEDARRDVPPTIRRAVIARYCAARGIAADEAFAAAMAAMAAQRHLRVAALWIRLARRDGKSGYLIHGERCWRLLERALIHPVTRPLREFLALYIPVRLRANPRFTTEHS